MHDLIVQFLWNHIQYCHGDLVCQVDFFLMNILHILFTQFEDDHSNDLIAITNGKKGSAGKDSILQGRPVMVLFDDKPSKYNDKDNVEAGSDEDQPTSVLSSTVYCHAKKSKVPDDVEKDKNKPVFQCHQPLRLSTMQESPVLQVPPSIMQRSPRLPPSVTQGSPRTQTPPSAMQKSLVLPPSITQRSPRTIPSVTWKSPRPPQVFVIEKRIQKQYVLSSIGRLPPEMRTMTHHRIEMMLVCIRAHQSLIVPHLAPFGSAWLNW